MSKQIVFDLGNDTSDLMPKGQYRAEITAVTLKDSKNTPGNQYINWEFTLVEEEYVGRKLWLITTLTKESIWKLRSTLKALGIVYSKGEQLIIEADEDGTVTTPDVVGTICTINVTTQKRDGEEVNQVKNIVGEGNTVGSQDGVPGLSI